MHGSSTFLLLIKTILFRAGIPVIPAPERLRQEDLKLEATMTYKARTCHKQTNISSPF
jgi:hypothetical protein